MQITITEDQAKMLLIVTGSMAGFDGSRGVYEMIRSQLRVLGPTPDPRIVETVGSIIVTDAMINSIRTM